MHITNSRTESRPEEDQHLDFKTPDFTRLGNSLIVKWVGLTKVLQIYASNNLALSRFIQESLRTLNLIIKNEGTLSLKIFNTDIFLNGKRLRYSMEGSTALKQLRALWEIRHIGEIIFHQPLDEKTLRDFITALSHLEKGCRENAVLLSNQLLNIGISSIEVRSLDFCEEDVAALFTAEDQRLKAQKTFFETISAVKGFMGRVDQLMVDEKMFYADARKLKRLVQKTVNMILDDDSWMLGMASIKNYDEYTFNHSVNVAIYSLAIGKRLMLHRNTLAELGTAALLHDIGKAQIPVAILNKPGSLDEKEWEIVKKHPVMGVETVISLKQLGEINERIILGIFDHHLNRDLTGYPKLLRRKELSLFGQIIRIADTYDAMTTPRIYREDPFTPEQSLNLMWKDAGTHFDPALMKIFSNLSGKYPIGSLVLLDNDELGIVYRSHPRRADRPQVILLIENEKGYQRKGELDLGESDQEGRFIRTIIKTLDPFKFGINVGSFFFK